MSPIAPNRLGTPSRPLAALLMRHPPCPLAPRTSRFHGADGPYTGSAGRARAGIRNFPKKVAICLLDSPLEGTGFEPSVPPKKRRPSREATRPTVVVSRDDL